MQRRRFGTPSPVEFDGDFRGHFPGRSLNFLGGIGQVVGVDVDADPAAGTVHGFARFQPPYALFKIMAAVRTLKFDHVGIDIRHQSLCLAQRPFAGRRFSARAGSSLTPAR
jgi:hypothetical protein